MELASIPATRVGCSAPANGGALDPVRRLASVVLEYIDSTCFHARLKRRSGEDLPESGRKNVIKTDNG